MRTTEALPPLPSRMNAELDQILNAHGGLFWLDGDHDASTVQQFTTITTQFKRHIELAKAHLYADRPRLLEFAFTSSSSLNAFAYASSNTEAEPFDFIAINVGVHFTLMNIFGRMLAHPGIFPEIGNSRLEDRDIHDLHYLSTDVMRSDQRPIAPKCQVRGIFAGELCQVALDFLFFHELTHLRNGHLEFARAHLSLHHWIEAASASVTDRHAGIRQALELDADCGAILLSLNHAFRLKDALTTTVKPVPEEIRNAMFAAYATPKLATRTVNFASYVLFRLFDTTTWAPSAQSQQSHPLPPLRMFLIGPTMHEIFSTRGEYQYDAALFEDDNARTILDAEIACGLVRGDKPDVRGLDSVLREHGYLTFLEQFKETWSTIRPELNKYKRGGNLAP